MYNWTSMNKMLSSKPIYSTCFSCLSTFKRIKNINWSKYNCSIFNRIKYPFYRFFLLRTVNTVKQRFVMSLPHITNIFLTNTFINHGCRRKSGVVILFNIFPERSHIPVCFYKKLLSTMLTAIAKGTYLEQPLNT